MRVVETIEAMRQFRDEAELPVGLVPTMGFLHEGHISLVRRAKVDNRTCVVSIFVNPTQFGEGEDLQAYPRDLERDLRMLRAEGVEAVFTPSVEGMYPPGSDTWVEPRAVAHRLEGAMRPGHFRGVVTVVAKLLNIVQPQSVYFGQKDAQQLVVIRDMVRSLHMPVEIVACPIVREPSGLAMSSRNSYLSAKQREAAAILHAALTEGQRRWQAGEKSAEVIRQAVKATVASEPEVVLQYVSVADPQTLEELERVPEEALLSLAARVGKSRLIDNVLLSACRTEL